MGTARGHRLRAAAGAGAAGDRRRDAHARTAPVRHGLRLRSGSSGTRSPPAFADGGNITARPGWPASALRAAGARLGAAVTTVRLSRRAGGAARELVRGTIRAVAPSIYALAAAGLAFLAFTWWPNGEYRPIQPGRARHAPGRREVVHGHPLGAARRSRQQRSGGAAAVAPNVRDAKRRAGARETGGPDGEPPHGTDEQGATTEETTTHGGGDGDPPRPRTPGTPSTPTDTTPPPRRPPPTTTDTTPTTTPTTP